MLFFKTRQEARDWAKGKTVVDNRDVNGKWGVVVVIK